MRCAIFGGDTQLMPLQKRYGITPRDIDPAVSQAGLPLLTAQACFCPHLTELASPLGREVAKQAGHGIGLRFLRLGLSQLHILSGFGDIGAEEHCPDLTCSATVLRVRASPLNMLINYRRDS